jgi:predicted dehydrogenase
MTIGVGFIGAGGIAAVHAAHLKEAGLGFATVFDVDARKVETFCKDFPEATPVKTQEALLADKRVEAVIIATPNKFHAPAAIAALEAGKDVLLEKPMAMNVAECDEIVAAVRKSGRILQMGMINRCLPSTIAALTFIEAGRLGQIYHAKAAYCRRRGIPGLGGWFTTKDLSGGGPLIDIGVHVIDLAWRLSGRPRPLRASGACYAKFGSPIAKYTFAEMWAGGPFLDGTCDVEDSAIGTIRFEGGMTLQVDAVWAANTPDDIIKDGIQLWGDQGGLYLNHITGELRLIHEDCGHVVEVRPDYAQKEAWVTQAERFRVAIETREQPDADAEQGRAVLAMLEALYRSSELEREVEID